MGPLRSFGPASIIDAFDASYAYGYAYSHPRLGAAGGPASGRVIEQAELAVEDLAAVLLIGCQLQRGPTIVLVDLETGSVSDEVTGAALGTQESRRLAERFLLDARVRRARLIEETKKACPAQ